MLPLKLPELEKQDVDFLLLLMKSDSWQKNLLKLQIIFLN
jgi:hypothetical protein